MPDSNYPEEPETTNGPEQSNDPYVDSPWIDSDPASVPGPGLIGAFLWMGGVFVVHLIGGIIALFVLAGPEFWKAAANGDERAINQSIAQITVEHGIALIGGEMVIFVIGAVIASLVAMGKDKSRKLGTNAIRVKHLLLLVSAVIPLSIISGGLHQLATAGIEWLTEGSDLAQRLQDMDTNKIIGELGRDASIWVLLPLIAMAPAISEELVFRGVIGRGLIARYGLTAGVIITSILFAVVHLSPAHVIAVMPLGLFMHYLYITTRSFWAPVLFHFLNNGMSAIMLKIVSASGANIDALEQEAMPALGVALAMIPITLIAITLWKSRVKFETPDGDEWSPGYVTLETPPNDSSAVDATEPAPNGLFYWSIVLGGLMILGHVVAVQMMLDKAAG